MKYKIFYILILLLISGCARSVIKYSSKVDENPYQMFGKNPAREFYLPIEMSDSLILKWESEVYGSFPNSSVTIYDELVFVNDLSGRIFCYKLEDGKEIGKLKYTNGSIFSTPIVSKSKIIFTVALDRDNLTDLIIYDYLKGKESEVIEIPGRVLSQMISDGEDIFFITETGTAFRYSSSGKKIWETNTRSPARSSPAMTGELFIFGNDEGEIIALNTMTGDSVYVKNIGGQFFSGLTISENTIYAGNENGIVYAMNIQDGELKWQFNTGTRIVMHPTVDEENVYIGNLNGSFFSINKTSGEQNWKTDFRSILNTTPLITKNRIILPDVLFAFHFLDKSSGKILKSVPLDGRAKLSPVIHKNTLFIGFDDGVIRAYEFVN